MLIKDRMTRDVAVAKPEDTIAKAFQILMERKHSQLPVIDNSGKLVGLITEKLLSEISPSKATALSAFEINYLLSKTKVQDIMKTEIFTIGPDELVETAAVIMKVNDIGSLPVIDLSGKLIGIVTRVDIFEAFIEITGVNDKGTRISLGVKDELGVIANISAIIRDNGKNITHISNFVQGDKAEVVVKVGDHQVEKLLTDFEESGYKVLAVHKI